MQEFNWFVGVVEDRHDPEYIGRVRVRVFGDHISDKSRIPTEDLPWAQVMMPVSSASLAGIGDSPTGILQGSWVVGFYMDGNNKQQPIIMGTIPGITSPADPTQGFADPSGINPVRVDEPDTPYAAMPFYYSDHPSYHSKVDSRVDDIETAVPPRVSSIAVDEADTYYNRNTWSSPQVQSGEDVEYPYNKVKETESGHVFEIDDTPGNERISQYHKSGTNYEIQRDGTKTETIVNDNYTVVFGTDNIYVTGNVNLTIDGDYRQLVKGNYHLEVNGNKTEQIRGSRQSKIAKNENMEVLQDLAYNVTGNYIQRTGGDETRIVDGNRNSTIGANEDLTITGDLSQIVMGKIDVFAGSNHATTTMGTLTITSQGNITVASPSNKVENINGNVTETFGGNQTTTVTGNIDMNATRIDLN
jgi:hypothetical protein